MVALVVRIRCCSDLFEGGGGIALLQWWWFYNNGGSLPSFAVALLSASGASFTVAWWSWSASGCAFTFRASCGSEFLLAAGGGSRCWLRCGEEDETVLAGMFASDKGGGYHGDGKRWWKLGLLEAWCRCVEEDGGGCCISPARMIGFDSILTRVRNGTLWLQVTTEAKRGAFWSHPNMLWFQTQDKMRKIIGAKGLYCSSVY